MRKIPLFRYGLESAVVLHRGGKRRRVRVRQRAVRNVQRPDARVREAEQVSVRIALCAKEERRVVVIAGAFDALDKPLQEAVLKAAAAAEKRGWEMSERLDKEYLKELAAKGMTVG